MKKTNIIFRLIIVSLIAVLFTAGIPKDTLAATDTLTWNGSGCPENCNWGEASNWDEGRIPKNGDSLVFPSFMNEMADSVNNIKNLIIGSITLSEDVPENITYNINLKETVTIFKGIYNYTNGFSGETEIEGEMSFDFLGISGSIILGADIEVETESMLSLAVGENDTINLNGHSMSFVDSSRDIDLSSTYLMVDIRGKIIGDSDSEIIIDSKNLAFIMSGDNTYSGKTNVNNGVLFVNLSKDYGNPFGESVLTINQSSGNNGKLEMRVFTKNYTLSNKIIILGVASIDDLALPAENEYPNPAITIYQDIGENSVFTFGDLALWGSAYLYHSDYTIGEEVSPVGLTDISSLKLFDVTGKTVACDMLRFVILDDDKFLLTNDAEAANFITNLDKNGCAISQYVKEAAKDVTKVEEEAVEVKAPNTVAKIVMNNPSMALLMGLVSIISIIIFKKSITSKYK